MPRYAVGMPFAGLITAALFVLMYAMIRPGEVVTWSDRIERPFIPAPPERYEPEPNIADPVDNTLPAAPPPLRQEFARIDTAGRSDVLARPDLSVRELVPTGGASPSGLFPLMTMSPAYPANCLARGTNGYAVVRFDVTQGGQVVNAVVTDSSHRCFERAALDAIGAWRYQPAMTTERGYIARGETKRFAFEVQ